MVDDLPPLIDTALIKARFSLYPQTPLQIDVLLPKPVQHLTASDFVTTLAQIRRLAQHLSRTLRISRFALASTGDILFSLIPLHGISNTWTPMSSGDDHFWPHYPGYLTSFGGPSWPEEELDEIVTCLRVVSGLSDQDLDLKPDDTPLPPPTSPSDEIAHQFIQFLPHDPTNLFGRLIRSEIPSWRFRDTPSSTSFLTPFPNTPGTGCVIPRRHLISDIFALPETAFDQLMMDVWETTAIVRKAFGVEKVGIFFEGYEINWAHVKFWPIWEGSRSWTSRVRELKGLEQREEIGLRDGSGLPFQPVYAGYLSTMKGGEITPGRRKELSDLTERVVGGLHDQVI
ncbi:MAG: hypothetical protein TREMPRED_001085 [Tremellales sp. Tagirdzhanova-0007]|nr:MAG: hypothetical protein TREMPRED_001085 [Tremellales sp. Tagirdzhanova-0007]